MSGRRTVEAEILEESRQFGRIDYSPPVFWYLELCTNVGDDSIPGTPISNPGWIRKPIPNNETTWKENRPRKNATILRSSIVKVETIVRSFELWDAMTGGTRRYWGRFYSLITGNVLESITIPAGYRLAFRTGKFLYYED